MNAPAPDQPPAPRQTGLRGVFILGPTAAGKSAVAMALADRLPVEIISVDSAQVYRGLDIGTAKPTVAERRTVPHHLIDIRDVADPYNAARFVADANLLLDAIRARGRLPLLVGGTMLYARALLRPFDALPAADPALRARLDREAADAGWGALHRRLATLDPASAARINPGDPQRIQRALEVIELTGRPLSALQSPLADRSFAAGVGLDPSLPILALEPSDRAALHRRIARRFDAMLAAGLIDEVRALRAQRGPDPALQALPALRSVGYRQVWQVLAGERPAAGLREAGIAATRQLAKRQLTWLRALPAIARLDCAGDTVNDTAGDAAVARLAIEASAIIERLRSHRTA